MRSMPEVAASAHRRVMLHATRPKDSGQCDVNTSIVLCQRSSTRGVVQLSTVLGIAGDAAAVACTPVQDARARAGARGQNFIDLRLHPCNAKGGTFSCVC